MEKVCIRSLVESGSLESRRYYLARRTLIEMLRDRGYVVPDIEVQLRLSLAEFRAAFGDHPEAERLRISAVHLCRCCCHKSPTLSLTLSRTSSRISVLRRSRPRCRASRSNSFHPKSHLQSHFRHGDKRLRLRGRPRPAQHLLHSLRRPVASSRVRKTIPDQQRLFFLTPSGSSSWLCWKK